MLTISSLPTPRIIFNSIIEREKFIYENNVYSQWFAIVLISGSYEVTMRGVCSVAHEGDVVVFPPGIPFVRRIITPIKALYINFDWNGIADDESCFGELYPCGRLEFSDRRRIAENLIRLREMENLRTSETLALSGHYFCDIWYEFCRNRAERIRNGIPAITDSVTAQAVSFIDKNYGDSITIASLARRACMSHVGFTNHFAHHMSMPPIEYLTGVRMSNAVELLTSTDLPVADISRRCGYENPFYFSRIFRARMGMPPSEYRRAAIL